MKRRKAISMLLAMALILTLLPVFAQADEVETVQNGVETTATADSDAIPDESEIMETDMPVNEAEPADEAEEPEAENTAEDGDAELCGHGGVADACAICAVEAQIAALPSAEETAAMDAAGQEQAYAQASTVCDEYYALTEEEQAQVSNSEKLFELLDWFSGGITVLADEEEDVCETCGAAYDNGICPDCGGYQSAEQNSDGYYEIGNAGQLFWFAQQVNSGDTSVNAVLTADIDLNPGYTFSATDGTYSGDAAPREWTPIGNASQNYCGVFDGKGYTISGLYINTSSEYQGLFGYIHNGSVYNVVIYNSSITASKYIGGIVGYITASTSAETCFISGCAYYGYIEGVSTGVKYVGGIAGHAANCVVTDCMRGGSVVSESKYVGGIAGELIGVNGVIRDCHNTGTVSGNSYVGGVVGRMWSSAKSVENCSNSGSISGNGDYVGGVIGSISSGDISGCSNSGSVESTSKNVGGVIGNLAGGSVAACCNSGNISGSNNAGGVVGYMNSSSDAVTNCFNSGSVYGNDSSNSYGYMGGVVAYLNSGTVCNCYSIGSVSGNTPGGIAGHVYTKGTITNSYFLDTAAADGVALNESTKTIEATSKTKEQFSSGEVTWLLNSGVTDGTQVWYQTLGTDEFPVFSGKTVYYEESRGYYNEGSEPSPTVYSVEIEWGGLSFAYQAASEVWDPETHTYNETAGGWSCGEDADKITVTNNSETAVDIALSYAPEDGYSGITGSFDKASSTLAVGDSESFALALEGAPDETSLEALTSAVVGRVTVTITGNEQRK